MKSDHAIARFNKIFLEVNEYPALLGMRLAFPYRKAIYLQRDTQSKATTTGRLAGAY